MASFVGTNKEFRQYIGPRLRNLVQQFTKKHKAEVSACEHCGTKESLESAHVRGRDRNEIIDLVLKDSTSNGVATVDIAVFEERFRCEHQPLERSILILCKSCHKKYDSKTTNSILKSETEDKSAVTEHDESYLPITLVPSDPDTFRKRLLLSKQATIEIFYSDDRVESKLWNASRFSSSSNVFGNLRSRPEFRSGKWQANGIIKVNVKVLNLKGTLPFNCYVV